MSTKVWFITGAARGMGVDIAKAALAAGHRVVGTARDAAKVTAAVGEHENLLALSLDVTDEAAADAAGPDLAGIIVSAFRHDMGVALELPDPAFARSARALCDATGAALILDDVRAGFRLDLGGSWEIVGVRPDLAAYSKAIANGHALAAVTDRAEALAA